jgi:hypothetical protein
VVDLHPVDGYSVHANGPTEQLFAKLRTGAFGLNFAQLYGIPTKEVSILASYSVNLLVV